MIRLEMTPSLVKRDKLHLERDAAHRSNDDLTGKNKQNGTSWWDNSRKPSAESGQQSSINDKHHYNQ